METALVLQFALTAGLFSLMPGADWAYAITAGLRSRSIVAPILGLASGYVVVVSVIAVGVGAVVASSPGILTALTVVGASYILWLGVSTLLGVKSGDGTLVSVTGTESAYRSDSLRQYLHGMGVSGINPKGLMLLLALLPQFLTEGGWASGVQILLLGGIFILEILVVYSGVAVAARSLLRSRPRLSMAVSVASGLFLTVFGTWLLLDALVG
ncbi:LysE family translocator [Corynebacterium variabile]|uniref:LysE family translocator n=1 Tax=Corynebacterium variabile TaxID=1727 RepID=UPI001D91E998|nr:LysE family transporter [Corynebacterium variabile]HJG46257.1 LysE family transporter [Corynebacterium variabile]